MLSAREATAVRNLGTAARGEPPRTTATEKPVWQEDPPQPEINKELKRKEDAWNTQDNQTHSEKPHPHSTAKRAPEYSQTEVVFKP